MQCNAMQKKKHPGAEERNQLGSQTLNISLTGQLIWSWSKLPCPGDTGE